MNMWEKLNKDHKKAQEIGKALLVKSQVKLVKDQLKKNPSKADAARAIGISRQRLNGFIVDNGIDIKKDNVDDSKN